MNIAFAHDSFTQLGGAERVVDAFHEMYPEAPVFTLVINRSLKDKYRGWDIRTSWLQILYNVIPKLQFLLPFVPFATASLNFEGYTIILSSSSSFIKNIRVPKGVVHICYCHTPTRFLWTDGNYIRDEVPMVLQPLASLFLSGMKRWDYRRAQHVTKFIANSKEVQNRIKKYYNRESEIVYPFINLNVWYPVKEKGGYFLLGGRLQAHKKTGLIVEIFNELGAPLHIVGTGRQENYLRSIAKPNISFLGRVSDEQLRNEYSGALGFLYPQLEDFGLMPLEAAACGTATLAYGQGGALETVIPGQTGELFETHDKEKIKELIKNWQPEKYTKEVLIAHAKSFSEEKFKKNILNILQTPHA